MTTKDHEHAGHGMIDEVESPAVGSEYERERVPQRAL